MKTNDAPSEIRSSMENSSLMWIPIHIKLRVCAVFCSLPTCSAVHPVSVRTTASSAFPLLVWRHEHPADELEIQETLRLLVFDCLVINEQNVMSKPLSKRYGVSFPSRAPHILAFVTKLNGTRSTETATVVLRPIRETDARVPAPTRRSALGVCPCPSRASPAHQPSPSIKIKQMRPSYHVEKVIKEDIPKVQHGNDGLIYTCAESGYVVGTDQRMYVSASAHIHH